MLRRFWWLGLLALASAPLLWARWPVDAKAQASAGPRPLSMERLIESWRLASEPAEFAVAERAEAGSDPDARSGHALNPHGAAAAGSSPATATRTAASRRPREGGGPERNPSTQAPPADADKPALRLLSAQAGDATRVAEIRFEREGVRLLQRLDPSSGVSIGAPEPLPASTPIPREVMAAFGGCAWILLAAPWLRRRLRATAGPSAHGRANATWWVLHASQTGQAQQLAERTAARLRALGVDARLLCIAELDAAGLSNARRLLLVASTTGEGDAPDTAAAFVRRLMPQRLVLPELRFAVLALGDRSYREYCAFGRALDAWLQGCSARPLFERIEVDDGDPQAIGTWLQAVESAARGALDAAADELQSQTSRSPARTGAGAEQGGTAATPARLTPLTALKVPEQHAARQTPPPQRWRLVSRTRLNPQSGAPALCEIELAPIGPLPSWEPGDVAVLQTQNSAARVQRWLAAQRLDGAESVRVGGDDMPLRVALRERALDAMPPVHSHEVRATHNAQARMVETVEPIGLDAIQRLPRLPTREYSIASTPSSGRLRLIVRRQNNADGRPGLGSGTLLDSPIGSELKIRLRSNPGFRPPLHAAPLILIGAGSGLAGLLGLLDARIEQGARANWLLFGERDPQHDRVLAAELGAHLDAGRVQRLDLCFSRDPDAPAYVQHALRAQAERLRDWLACGAHLRVCGSRRGMGEGVHATLTELLGEDAVDALLAAGRYRREVF